VMRELARLLREQKQALKRLNPK